MANRAGYRSGHQYPDTDPLQSVAIKLAGPDPDPDLSLNSRIRIRTSLNFLLTSLWAKILTIFFLVLTKHLFLTIQKFNPLMEKLT